MADLVISKTKNTAEFLRESISTVATVYPELCCSKSKLGVGRAYCTRRISFQPPTLAKVRRLPMFIHEKEKPAMASENV